MKAPPTQSAKQRVLSCSYDTYGFHASSVLSSRTYFRLLADDFKPGFHLEVGETIATDNAGQARRHQGDLPDIPDPSRDADNRKASRAHDPCYRVGLSAVKQIGADGVSGYPAPSISRALGKGLCLNPTSLRISE